MRSGGLKLNVRTTMQMILIYIMIIMHGAVIWSAVLGDGYASLLIVTLIIFSAIMIFQLPFTRSYLLFCIVTAICYFISSIMNGIGMSSGLNIKTALIIDINILIAMTIYNMGKEKAITLFVKTVTCFAFISIICFSFQETIGTDIFPSELFPYVNWGRGHYGYLIYSYTADDRNYGIFYEPGVYQVLLNATLYILCFWDDEINISEKLKSLCIIVVLVAIVSAGSTTGYISAGIIISGVILKRQGTKTENGHFKKNIFFIAIIAFCVLGLDYLRNGVDSVIGMYVLAKIEETNIGTGTYNYNSSGGARLFVFNQAIEALKTNPFFGVGSINLSNAIANEFFAGFGTGNALFSTIATKGLVTTVITIAPLIVIAARNRKSNIQFIVFLLIYTNTIVAQSQLLYSVFVLLALLREEGQDENVSKQYIA